MAVLTTAYSERMQSMLISSQVVELSRPEHHVNLTNPEEFYSVVDEFFIDLTVVVHQATDVNGRFRVMYAFACPLRKECHHRSRRLRRLARWQQWEFR